MNFSQIPRDVRLLIVKRYRKLCADEMELLAREEQRTLVLAAKIVCGRKKRDLLTPEENKITYNMTTLGPSAYMAKLCYDTNEPRRRFNEVQKLLLKCKPR